MNPIEFALRRPITVMVAMVALVAAGGLAVYRMKVDIFPSLNLPVVYVAQPYGGMDPAQMEGLIANYYEYHFLYINGIHHVERSAHRPGEGGGGRGDDRGGGPFAGGGDLVEPVRGAELLARPGLGHRLPGPGGDPQALMRSGIDVETVPVKPNSSTPLLVRDVADVKEGTMPGEIDRYNMRRVVGMTANIEGEDLGRVAGRITEAIQAAGDLPAGVQVDVRGQVTPMREMFQGLAIGLAVAVVVIFLLLTAYFQSMRLSLSAVAAVPAGLCGHRSGRGGKRWPGGVGPIARKKAPRRPSADKSSNVALGSLRIHGPCCLSFPSSFRVFRVVRG